MKWLIFTYIDTVAHNMPSNYSSWNLLKPNVRWALTHEANRLMLVGGSRVMKALSRFKRGQAVVILTLVIPALVGAVALGTDVALFYYNWIKLQRATDAAAVRGAGYSAPHPNLAASTATNLASLT